MPNLSKPDLSEPGTMLAERRARIGAALSSIPGPRLLWQGLWIQPDLATEDGRARDRYRRVVLTAGTSALAKVITITASLVTVPLALHYLGPERYGIWMVISSFTMMLAFADMGLGNGIVNAIAREHGLDNRVMIREIVSSGYCILSLVGLVILLAFALGYPFIPWSRLFNVRSPQAIAEAGPALATFMVCFALVIPLTLVQKVQIALQQGFVSGIWQCAGSLLGMIGLLLVVWFGAPLPWLVAALAGAPLLMAIANSLHFFLRAGRDIAPSPACVSTTAIRTAAGTGLQFFVLQLVVSLAYGFDTMIIAQTNGASAVAAYSVPERLFGIISMLLTIVMAPLWPAYGEAIARGDKQWVKRTLARSLYVAVGVSSVLSLSLVVFGPMLIRLWVGTAVAPSMMLLIGLALWKVVEAAGNTVAFYMNGANELRFQIAIAIICGGVMFGLKIWLVERLGIAGIPVAATIAFVLCAGIPTTIFVARRLR